MLPWLAPALGAIGSIGQMYGQSEANRTNISQSREARQWAREEREMTQAIMADMSNTEVERRVRDLKRSGLNPMLALQTGASSPGATTPGANQATVDNVAGGLVGNVSQAVLLKQQVKKAKQEVKNMEETEGLIKEQKGKTKADKEAVQKGLEAREFMRRIFEPFVGSQSSNAGKQKKFNPKTKRNIPYFR